MTPEVRAAAVAALAEPLSVGLSQHYGNGRTWNETKAAAFDIAGRSLSALLASPDRARALVAALGGGLPDEDGVANWPGGGTRVTKDVLGDPTWTTDPDGAWVVLYAPRQFYDGLRALTQPDTRSEP